MKVILCFSHCLLELNHLLSYTIIILISSKWRLLQICNQSNISNLIFKCTEKEVQIYNMNIYTKSQDNIIYRRKLLKKIILSIIILIMAILMISNSHLSLAKIIKPIMLKHLNSMNKIITKNYKANHHHSIEIILIKI